MTNFTIHIRGVGVYVAKSSSGTGVVTEMLFPVADRHPPDGEDLGSPSPGKPRDMKHADKTKANEHFVGAILSKNGHEEFHEIAGCRVQLSEDTGGHTNVGASFKPPFVDLIPPLQDIITDSARQLFLLREGDREDVDRVAARLIVEGGDIRPSESSHQSWIFSDAPGDRGEREYLLEGTWTITADRLVFEIIPFGDDDPKDTIELDADATDVYFFNFDKKHPKISDLTDIVFATRGFVDDDFKWVYKLFKKTTPFSTWQEWMTSDFLPAPRLAPPPKIGTTAVSVSTCFEVVWTGPEET